jgi:RNA polymerase sigma-70 factor (ECF subfamily)
MAAERDDAGLGARSDEELVSLAQHAPPGDLRAFTELIARHQPGVAANCRHMTGSVEDSQDLTQEVLVKAYFALQGFRGSSQFRSWLWRIKINHCLRFLERANRVTFVELDDEATTDFAETGGEGSENLQQLVSSALDHLPDTLRVPVVLRDLDGLAYQQIADTLGIGLSAAKMRVKRGREGLKVALIEMSPELAQTVGRESTHGGTED